MRFLLNRKLVVPVVCAIGLLVALGGEVEAGTWIDAIGVGYWIIAGWVTGFQRRRIASRPVRQFTAQVAAMSSRARRSDGANGAFSRLDPAWRDWLTRETPDGRGKP